MKFVLAVTSSLAAAVVLVSVAGATLVGCGATPRASGARCTLHVHPGLAPRHLGSLKAKPRYNSFPPSSGPHYFQPAVWGIYDTPLPQVQLVHNLEHGGVVVQYGSRVGVSTVQRITDWYAKHETGVIVAPLPALGATVALTAWNAPPYGSAGKVDAGHGYVERCDGFDDRAFTRFLTNHQFKGGERFPPSALQHGT